MMHCFRHEHHQEDNRGTSHHARDQYARVLERAVEQTGRGSRQTGVQSGGRLGQFPEAGAGGLKDAVD
jgi:hypothetical protein